MGQPVPDSAAPVGDNFTLEGVTGGILAARRIRPQAVCSRGSRRRLEVAGESEGWPTESLEIAYRSSLQCGLVNEFYSKKTYPSPSKTTTIKLFCEFGTDEAKHFAVVMHRRKELGRVFLGATAPESYIVWMTQQSFAWISDQAVQIQIVHPDFGRPTVHDLSSVLSVVP